MLVFKSTDGKLGAPEQGKQESDFGIIYRVTTPTAACAAFFS